MKYTIKPSVDCGSGRTGGLKNITVYQINDILGFEPNAEDDPVKVVNSWGFTLTDENGKVYEGCGIWDYKGSHMFNEFSTNGPKDFFLQLFGSSKVDEDKY